MNFAYWKAKYNELKKEVEKMKKLVEVGLNASFEETKA
jgi:hypothetical protein